MDESVTSAQETAAVQSASPDSHIRIVEKLSYGVGSFAEQMVFNPATSFIVFFYTDIAGLGAATVGAILLFSRVFDLLNPVMGLMVDRTQTRLGKGRPWLLWLAVPFGISTVLLFTAPSLSPMGKAIYAFVTYNLALAIIYPAIDIPYTAMLPLITPDQHQRTLLSLFRMVLQSLGGLVTFGMTLAMVSYFGGGAKGWNRSFVVFGVIGTVLLLVCFAGTRERIRPDSSKEAKVPVKQAMATVFRNKYCMLLCLLLIALFIMLGLLGSNIYYCRSVLGNVALMAPLMIAYQVSIISGMVSIGPLVKRLGKRNAALWGIAVAILGQAIMFAAPASLPVVFLGTILKGLGGSPLMGTLFAMGADAIEYGDWKLGIRAGGFVFGTMALVTKVAIGVGNAMVGFILGLTGYVAGATVQTHATQLAIKAMFLHLPLLMFVFMGLILLGYDLDRRYASIAAELQVRRSAVS